MLHISGVQMRLDHMGQFCHRMAYTKPRQGLNSHGRREGSSITANLCSNLACHPGYGHASTDHELQFSGEFFASSVS